MSQAGIFKWRVEAKRDWCIEIGWILNWRSHLIKNLDRRWAIVKIYHKLISDQVEMPNKAILNFSKVVSGLPEQAGRSNWTTIIDHPSLIEPKIVRLNRFGYNLRFEMKIFFHISHLFGKAEKSFLVLNLKLHLKLSFQVFSHLPTSRVLNYWWVILYDSLCLIWWEHYPQLGMVILNKWSDFESFWHKISIKVFSNFKRSQNLNFLSKRFY